MTTQALTKGRHSRWSSMMDASTTRSASTDRYAIEAERLDWAVPDLTDKHKKMYDACNKYKKEDAV